MADNTRRNKVSECPADLDETLWTNWCELLNREEAIWLAQQFKIDCSARNKIQAVTGLIKNCITLPTRNEYDYISGLDKEDPILQRYLAWMQVQPQDFLTAVWANCYEKLGDVLKMKADEARRFVALISDPPPARIIERLPRVTLESLTASSSSSTSSSSSSSSSSSEDATEGGPDLGNEILDFGGRPKDESGAQVQANEEEKSPIPKRVPSPPQSQVPVPPPQKPSRYRR